MAALILLISFAASSVEIHKALHDHSAANVSAPSTSCDHEHSHDHDPAGHSEDSESPCAICLFAQNSVCNVELDSPVLLEISRIELKAVPVLANAPQLPPFFLLPERAPPAWA